MEPGISTSLLICGHLPRVLELTALAGWNQTLSDLERMLAIAPDSAFGLFRDGQLVSTAMAFPYGAELGWVAMVLTHPDARGHGFATILTRQAIEWLQQHQTAWIKLDASAFGQPVYERLGFIAESRMERHLLPSTAHRPSADDHRDDPSIGPAELPIHLDRAAFGADRSRLLHLLLRIPGIRHAVLPGGEGYAMLRPGAKALQLGPMVSRSFEGAQRLLHWALRCSAGNPLQWDLNTDNAAAVALATNYGFTPQRVLSRMTLAGRPAPPPFEAEANHVYAIAGFDFG